MAKELPYFKFEPGQWDSGNIQMCSRESKGLFIDLCSLYWNRLGELPYALALQKLCNGNKDALQELVSFEIIAINEGKIFIEFLSEQLSEFGNLSNKRRKAAQNRWFNASALQVHDVCNAIREEEIREEEIRESIKTENFDKNSVLHEPIKKHGVNVGLLLKELPNTSHVETIAMRTGITKEKVLSFIPEFAKAAELTYPTPEKFYNHFKNWINIRLKQPSQTPKKRNQL